MVFSPKGAQHPMHCNCCNNALSVLYHLMSHQHMSAGSIKGDHPAGWQDKHPRGNPVMQRMSGLP